MDSTALTTFLYKTKPEVRSVELFGSWDNFSRPCRMQRDAHKGRGVWSGCHLFENIICDGERIDRSRPRNGALKQGGTYWYYYKHNDEEEACDLSRPTTAACPLLPGQTVNILEVPIEVIEPPKRVYSASADIPSMVENSMTFDPADRYKKIHRKPPTKLPRYYCSSDALRERFITDSPSRMSPDLRNRGPSPGVQSIKRVRRDEESYQKPGACQIDVTAEDMELLAGIPVDFDQTISAQPVLRPFAPCSQSSIEERPVTRGRTLTDFTKGLGFSFFSSKRRSIKDDQLVGEDTGMEYEYTSPPDASSPQNIPPYDGTFDELPRLEFSHSPENRPLESSVPSHFDDNNWPLTHPNPLQANPSTTNTYPINHATSAFTSNISSLDLGNPVHNNQSYLHPYPSPAPTSLSDSEDYHPGFGPNSTSIGTGFFDMTSPTFTAETASSSPEARTPERFLLVNPQTRPNTNLEDLSRRLSQLTSSDSGYDASFDESDVESVYHEHPSKAEFYNFAKHPDEQEDYGKDGTYTDSNASCLTLKAPSVQQRRLDNVVGLTIELPSTSGSLSGKSDVATEFSEDVLGALGISL